MHYFSFLCLYFVTCVNFFSNLRAVNKAQRFIYTCSNFTFAKKPILVWVDSVLYSNTIQMSSQPESRYPSPYTYKYIIMIDLNSWKNLFLQILYLFVFNNLFWTKFRNNILSMAGRLHIQFNNNQFSEVFPKSFHLFPFSSWVFLRTLAIMCGGRDQRAKNHTKEPPLMAHSHCTDPGPVLGPELGTGTMDFYILCCTVHTALRQGHKPDPLSPIVLVLFPVPAPVPVLCSVNKQLHIHLLYTHNSCTSPVHPIVHVPFIFLPSV